MTRVQMIVTASGQVINFDNVDSIKAVTELAHNHETTINVIYAYMVGGKTHVVRTFDFDDKETVQTCLMSELKRAKQTDGIARFDGDIMARLHEKGV